jgi:hypothetical protein
LLLGDKSRAFGVATADDSEAALVSKQLPLMLIIMRRPVWVGLLAAPPLLQLAAAAVLLAWTKVGWLDKGLEWGEEWLAGENGDGGEEQDDTDVDKK